MTLEQLICECRARTECTIDGEGCPFRRECDLIEDIFGPKYIPCNLKSLSEHDQTAILKRILERFGGE